MKRFEETICRRARLGFTMLELQVAMVVLGIAMMGLIPLSVMHSRAMRSLDQRYARQGQWYLAPSSDAWVQKLGAAASFSRLDPGPKPAPPVLIADDGDAGYSEMGEDWTSETGSDTQAFGQDRRRHGQSAAVDTAVWTFSDVPVGWYQVQATWLEAPDRATDAHYTLYDGALTASQVNINQQAAPSGVTFSGRPWQTLAIAYLRNGAIRLQLNSNANGSVVADCVRLVPYENTVQVLSLERSLTSEAITAHVSVTQPVP
jgi:prepilin-type N-terminal cleavage/methylation domain-containing protein